MSLRLSLVDFHHDPAAVREVARLADRAGFQRIWVGEHHSKNQCPNPLLLAGLLASETQRLRVGTAAVVMDGSKNPYHVAQDARIISQVHGDRLDLGVTLQGLPQQQELLASVDQKRWNPEKSVELLFYVLHHELLELEGAPEAGDKQDPADAWLRRIQSVVVSTEHLPRMWLMGRQRHARLAARLGVGFCDSFFHPGGSLDAVKANIDLYKREFVPGPFDEPEAVVIISGVCAPDQAFLDRRAELVSRQPPVHFFGLAPQCREMIASAIASVGASEAACLFTEHITREELPDMVRSLGST